MKKNNSVLGCVISSLLFLVTPNLSAEDFGEIEWHGFLTSAMIVTDGAGEDVHYSGDISDNGGFKDTRFGLNLSTQLDDTWKISAQLKASGLEDFNLEVDWAYASLQLSESSTVRFGRIKYPIGLVNEFLDIGYSYLWIRPPESIYSQELIGPNMTRISYNGVGVTFGRFRGDNEYTLDIFTGVVDVKDGHVNKLFGLKGAINIADEIRFELAANTGVMEIEDVSPRWAMMDNKTHNTAMLSFSIDKSDFIFVAEIASATMGFEIMDTDSDYATIGYRIGKYTPHFTFERWSVQGGWGQEISTLGLRREITDNSAFKIEIKQITPTPIQKPPCPGPCTDSNGTGGVGLFDNATDVEDVIAFGMSLEMVF